MAIPHPDFFTEETGWPCDSNGCTEYKVKVVGNIEDGTYTGTYITAYADRRCDGPSKPHLYPFTMEEVINEANNYFNAVLDDPTIMPIDPMDDLPF